MGIDDALRDIERDRAADELAVNPYVAAEAAYREIFARLAADFFRRVDGVYPATPIGTWVESKKQWSWSPTVVHSFEPSGLSGWQVNGDLVMTTDRRWIVGNTWEAPAEGTSKYTGADRYGSKRTSLTVWKAGPRPCILANATRDSDSPDGLFRGTPVIVEVEHPRFTRWGRKEPAPSPLDEFRAKEEQFISRVFAECLLQLQGKPVVF